MSRKAISVRVLKKVVKDIGDVFTTKDVSEDPRVMNAHRKLVNHSQYHAFVGGALSDHRQHEFNIQLLAFDSAKSGQSVGVGVQLGFCSALLKKSLKNGLVLVGGLNLGGGIDPVYNAVNIAGLAIEKGAETLLIPISARRQLIELTDELAMKINIVFYADVKEALVKGLVE